MAEPLDSRASPPGQGSQILIAPIKTMNFSRGGNTPMLRAVGGCHALRILWCGLQFRRFLFVFAPGAKGSDCKFAQGGGTVGRGGAGLVGTPVGGCIRGNGCEVLMGFAQNPRESRSTAALLQVPPGQVRGDCQSSFSQCNRLKRKPFWWITPAYSCHKNNQFPRTASQLLD